MPLDFPTSPTDGQIYDNYYWDNTNSVWRLLSDSLEVAADFSNTATGTYTDGFNYKYISFTADGTLTVTRGGYADVLLVGGGGGGGGSRGGGGGGGALLYIENAYIPAGSLDVVVGAGGAAGIDVSDRAIMGDNGKPSSLWKYFAPGGGAGGTTSFQYNSTTNWEGTRGISGGSGGGGGGGAFTGAYAVGGSGVTGLGNNGGNGENSGNGGGGGGGAGAAGADAVSVNGGDGGNGASNSITGSAVIYAGGGGGGGAVEGSGGTGGGGDGANSSTYNGSAGTANTGGGGGGGYSTNSDGAAGGSGIVIVRVRTN